MTVIYAPKHSVHDIGSLLVIPLFNFLVFYAHGQTVVSALCILPRVIFSFHLACLNMSSSLSLNEYLTAILNGLLPYFVAAPMEVNLMHMLISDSFINHQFGCCCNYFNITISCSMLYDHLHAS